MVRSTALMQHDRSGPDPARIAALSVAILANLTIFAFLMQPMHYTLPAESAPQTTAQIIRKEEIKPLVAPVEPRKQEQTKPNVTVVARTPTITHPKLTVVTADPGPMSLPTPPDAMASGDGDTGTVIAPAGPVETALTPLFSPAPPYPRDAMRDGITGTVLLELTVGTDGRVLDVQIVHGSGNRHLDEAARDQVLRKLALPARHSQRRGRAGAGPGSDRVQDRPMMLAPRS